MTETKAINLDMVREYKQFEIYLNEIKEIFRESKSFYSNPKLFDEFFPGLFTIDLDKYIKKYGLQRTDIQ